MKYILFFLLLLGITGCQTTMLTAPDDIKQMAKNAQQYAKTSITSTGTKLPVQKPVEVRKMKGQKKIGDMWCWQLNSGKQWITGMTQYVSNRCLIHIGSNPTTGGEVRELTLRHEMAHAWLVSNHQANGHDPKYQRFFENWYGANISSLKDIDMDNVTVIHYLDENTGEMGVLFLRNQ